MPKQMHLAVTAITPISAFSRISRRIAEPGLFEATGSRGGFMLGHSPCGLRDLLHYIVALAPELQRRGSIRNFYTGCTMREIWPAEQRGRQSTRTGLDHGVAHDPYRCSQKRAVASHDLAVEQHELARRMSGDSFGDAAGSDREEIGRAANRYAEIADANRSRAGGADQVEGDFHLVIAAEIGLPADHRRTLQQVAGAVGGPGVADVRRCRRTPAPRRRAASRPAAWSARRHRGD